MLKVAERSKSVSRETLPESSTRRKSYVISVKFQKGCFSAKVRVASGQRKRHIDPARYARSCRRTHFSASCYKKEKLETGWIFFLSQIIWAKFTHQSPQPANTAGIHPTRIKSLKTIQSSPCLIKDKGDFFCHLNLISL